jgi:hypothetical protein
MFFSLVIAELLEIIRLLSNLTVIITVRCFKQSTHTCLYSGVRNFWLCYRFLICPLIESLIFYKQALCECVNM